MSSTENDSISEEEIRALHQSLDSLNKESDQFSQNGGRQAVKNCDTLVGRKRTSAAHLKTNDGEKRKKRNKKVVNSEEIVTAVENELESVLQEKAERNNLTAVNVKSMIRSIILDENVIDMLKNSVNTSVPPSDATYEPKLTRSRFKELLGSSVLPSLHTNTTSETLALIEKEFSENSDDEEYRPSREDLENQDDSDEESFISSVYASDAGSPTLSLAPSTPNVQEDIFKKPHPIEDQDNIVCRTRSKLPMTDTSLQHLEMAFVPPDITTDMYDSDCDEEWAQFLKEYVCPPPSHTAEAADDDEADPEYNILEEDEVLDVQERKEELRVDKGVIISRKEYKELLFDLSVYEAVSDEEVSQASCMDDDAEDFLQTALDNILDQESSSTVSKPVEPTKPAQKPTGIVLPTVVCLPEIVISCPMFAKPIRMQCTPCGPTANVHEETYPHHVLFPEETKLLLHEQLRKHVQLSTQMHLITARQEQLCDVASNCKSMLYDLTRLSISGEIYNLAEAVELVDKWETFIAQNPSRRQKHENFHRTVAESSHFKEKVVFVNRTNRHPHRLPFDPDMVSLMADSRVFIYPQLLPKVAIMECTRGPCVPSLHEEQLIAMGLEQFTPYCKEIMPKSDDSMVRKAAVNMISSYMLPHWSAKKIADRINRLQKPNIRKNAVQYYRKHKKAPAITHELEPFDPTRVPTLREMDIMRLPKRWRENLMTIPLAGKSKLGEDRKIIPLAGRSKLEEEKKKKRTEQLTTQVSTSPYNSRRHRRLILPSASSPSGSPDNGADSAIFSAGGTPNNADRGELSLLASGADRLIDSGITSTPFATQVRSGKRMPDCFGSPIINSRRLSFPGGESDSDEDYQRISSPVKERPPRKRGRPLGRKNKPRFIVAKKRRLRIESTSDEASPSRAVPRALPDAPCDQSLQQEPTPADLREAPLADPQCEQALQQENAPPSHPPGTPSVNVQCDELPLPMFSPGGLAGRSSVGHDKSSKQDTARLSEKNSEGKSSDRVAINYREVACTSFESSQAKRYVLIKRINSSTAHLIHVWGPPLPEKVTQVSEVLVDGDHVPERSCSKKETSSSCGTSQATSQADLAAEIQVQKVTGGGNSGGDEGNDDKARDIRHLSDAVDEIMVDEEEEEEEEVKPSVQTARSKVKSPAHRVIRHQRNAKRILDSWMADEELLHTRNIDYAEAYYNKVRQVLEPSDPAAYKAFNDTILGDGDGVISTVQVLDFYHKIEEILKPYPDLQEEFIVFLNREQATICGKEFQHFLYVRMREFFAKLKIYYKDSPFQLKRVLKILQQAQDSPSASVNDVKLAILPILKGNQHLTQTFLELFPDGIPPQSPAADFEDVNIEQQNSGDEFEYVDLTQEVISPTKESDSKSGKRSGSKNSVKNKSKGKAWKK